MGKKMGELMYGMTGESVKELGGKWVELNGFPSYEVNPDEGIRNKKTGKVLKGRNWLGYPKVTLMKNRKKHEKKIHRLVGEQFIPNPNKLPIINHKDNDRSNFSLSNLEWVDNSGNQLHRWATERTNKNKKRYTMEYSLSKGAMVLHPKSKGGLSTIQYMKKGMSRKEALRAAKKAAKEAALESEYKSVGMGSLRRAVNRHLPFNQVLW